MHITKFMKGRAGIKADSKQIIKVKGCVSLLRLERLGVVIYGVEYPAKFHGREIQQFLVYLEADLCFHRYAEFFNSAGTRN